jgi:type VI secretion system protein ImpH
MPTTQRRRHASVIQRLLDAPYRFDLIQTMRMLELWLRKNVGARDGGLTQHVRFQNSVSMGFPASQIEALSVASEVPVATDLALQNALAAGKFQYIRITPAYMGFLGVNGVLPNRYTEDVAAQIQEHKTHGGRAFFDMFSNRIMALHYQAWAKYRVRERAGATDALLPMQLALAGVRAQGAASSAKVIAASDNAAADLCDEVPAYYAAMLRHRPMSACALAGVLTEYFQLPVDVIQFVGKWENLEQSEVCLLGKQNCLLGQGIILGPRSWERSSCVELRIGPLSREQFDDFFPGAPGIRALKALMLLVSAPAIDFDVRLVLRAADVKPIVLGDPINSRLGWGAFLVSEPSKIDRDDTVFPLRLLDCAWGWRTPNS